MYAPAPAPRRGGARRPPGFGDYGLRISFKHPFGKHSLFGKAKRVVGKVAKVALPIAAGGLALKFGLPLIKKGVGGIARLLHPTRPTATVPEAPQPTLPDQSALDTAAAATVAALSQAGIPPIPGATPYVPPPPTGPVVTTGGEVPGIPGEEPPAPEGAGPAEAGLFGAGGGKTMVILTAAGLGLYALTRGGRR